jgi:hypothetical protein
MLFLLLWELGIFNQEGLNGGILDSEDNGTYFATGSTAIMPISPFLRHFVLAECVCLF